VRFGLIGAGSITRGSHIPSLRQIGEARLVAVCDQREEVARRVAEEESIEHVFSGYRDLLKLKSVDAVIVATPNAFHAPISIEALNAGKHVLCEKPMAVSEKEAGAMVRAAEKSGRVFMLALNNRFKAESRFLKNYIERGEIGRIYYARAAFVRRRGSPGGWFSQRKYSGGGPLIDLGVHILDLILWLMGYPAVESVSGATSMHLNNYTTREIDAYKADWNIPAPSDVESFANAYLRTHDGGSIFLETSFALNCKEDRTFIEIHGERGGARLWPLEIFSEMDDVLLDITPHCGRSDSYLEENRHFVDCILHNRKPDATVRQGYEIVRILEAAYRSAEERREIKMEESSVPETGEPGRKR
jgi:predicted dehydrogenase